MPEDVFIWVNRWDEFQTFQKKRGKPWAPPWVKLYVGLLDQPAWIALPPETRSLLVGIWALFARSSGTLTKDTRNLSRQLSQRVTERQLERLNDAGFLDFCSGTVLEQRRSAFWNRSVREENRREENTKAVTSKEDTGGELHVLNGPGSAQHLPAQVVAFLRRM